jgi:hypothetical protein
MEAKTKKTIILLGIGAVAVTLSILAWKKYGGEPKPKQVDPIPPPPATEPTPVGSSSSKWIPETFPLKKGMFGGQIKNLQEAIGFSGSDLDGKFGSGTEAKVMEKFKKNSVTEPEYDALVNPKVPTTATTPASTKKTIDEYMGTWVKGDPNKTYSKFMLRNEYDATLFKEIPAGGDLGYIGEKGSRAGTHKITGRADDTSWKGLYVSDDSLNRHLALGSYAKK